MENSTLSTGSALQGGKYRIIKVLGQGGFGITYLAEQTGLGRQVAVKEFFMKEYCERDGSTSQISLGTSGSRELVRKYRAKFLKEARLIASLDNPHIVKVFDVFEENCTAYYVMEHLGGGSLADKIKRGGPLMEVDALRYIRGVASALSVLHSRNTLHLDVKPSNVMLNSEDEAVLIDFGISKGIDSEGHVTSSTPLGVSKGYAPFEQMAHDDESTYSPATDIYSLGVTLYYLLTARTPQDASALLKGFPTDDLDANGVSAHLISVIRMSMSVAKEDRPQSIGEFLNLLNFCTSNPDDVLDEETYPQTKSKPVAQKKSAGLPKWAYAVFVALIACIAAILALRNPAILTERPEIEIDSTEVVVLDEPVPARPSVSSSTQIVPSQQDQEEPSVIELRSISLSKTSLELEVGKGERLIATCIPSNTTDTRIIWESSNVGVVTVSSAGDVKALSAGYSSIIARCGGKTAYCNVTVKPLIPDANSSSNAVHESSEAKGSVFVESVPDGANILIDGNSISSTTTAIVKNLKIGRHKVSVSMDGYEPQEKEVNIRDGRDIPYVSFTLIKKNKPTLSNGRDDSTNMSGEGSPVTSHQKRTISSNGIIIDKETGEPIPFVSVFLKEDSKKGILTESNGEFVYKNVVEGTILVFRCIGYYEVEAPASTNMKILMKEDNTPLR